MTPPNSPEVNAAKIAGHEKRLDTVEDLLRDISEQTVRTGGAIKGLRKDLEPLLNGSSSILSRVSALEAGTKASSQKTELSKVKLGALGGVLLLASELLEAALSKV